MDTGVSIKCALHSKAPWGGEQQVAALAIQHPEVRRVERLVEKLEKLGWCAWIIGTLDGVPAAYLTKPGLPE